MRFHKIYIEITDICRLSCSFCTPKKAQRGIMERSLFERVAREIAPFTKLVSLHVLGDPLVVQNLSAYLAIAKHYNLRLDIVSSGIFLEKSHFTLLTENHVHQVSFSLDAFFNNARHDKNLQQNKESYIDMILDFYEYARTHAPHLYINLRLFGAYNYDFLLQRFPNFCMQEEKRRIRLARNLFLRFHKPFIWYAKNAAQVLHDAPHKKPYCLGSLKQLAILANGVVVPCCIDAKAKLPLGVLTQQDFESILHSKAMRAMQDAQRTHANLPAQCLSCNFRGV